MVERWWAPSPSAICFVLSPSTNSSSQLSLPTLSTPRRTRTRCGKDGVLCLLVFLIWSTRPDEFRTFNRSTDSGMASQTTLHTQEQRMGDCSTCAHECFELGACPSNPALRGEQAVGTCTAASSKKPEAYSLQYVEDFLGSRTTQLPADSLL